MKTKRQQFLLVLLIVIFLTGAGCIPVPSTLQPQTVTPTTGFTVPGPISSNLPPTKIMDFYTPPPALNSRQEQYLARLLQTRECKLPCYLNITPGQTSIKEARVILDGLGASFVSEKRLDSVIEYSYNINIRHPSTLEVESTSDALIYQTFLIRVALDSEIVQIIHVGIANDGTPESLDTFRKYWSRYLASSIFIEIGEPDELYTDSKKIGKGIESNLILVYERLGIFTDLRGTGYETNICREKENNNIALMMDLYMPSDTLNRYSFNNYLDDSEIWLPVEDALGIGVQDFYMLVSAHPAVCFLY